jgi:hypothetical protein
MLVEETHTVRNIFTSAEVDVDLIIKTLSYFKVFSYPLTRDQLYLFYPCHIESHDFQRLLRYCIENGIVHEYLGYLSLYPSLPSINNRLLSEIAHRKIWKSAVQNARLIHRFPFVLSVSISGSCAKGVFPKDADVDFFIITQPGKLWLCRTLLVLYKKIFRANSHRFFCINYLIASDAREIPDKNLFTAIELATLVNITGKEIFSDFEKANSWYRQYLPNHKGPVISVCPDPKKYFVFRWLEQLKPDGLLGKTDDLLLRLSHSFRKRKFNNMDKEQFNLNLRTLKSVSKHHPRGFQYKVLQRMEEIYKQVALP